MRSRALILLLLSLTSACNFGLARKGATPPSETALPVTYGEDLEFSPPPVIGGKGKGTLVIYVLEQDTNRPIAGARVRYRGPEKGTMVSNARGRATARVRSGVYNVQLPPCGERVMTTTFAEADVGVVPGGKAGGPLFTTWEHRFVPSHSVRMSDDPPWRRGREISLGVRIEDRCDFSEAEGASLNGTHAWRVSNNFAFTEQPSLRAGADGYLTVTIRCVRKGNGEIVIYNRFDPEDNVDLLLAASAPPPGESFCR